MIKSHETINVLGFHTSILSREDILKAVTRWVTDRKNSNHLMALNPIKVCRARKEELLAQHIVNADLLYPDAYGIAWAMTQFSGTKYPTIPGCDLMCDIMKLASKNKNSVFLLGGSQAIVEKAKVLFQREYPGAAIVGIRNGYFKNDDDMQSTLSDIMTIKPDIVFVAMGALIQENWIEMIRTKARQQSLVIPVCMGVGGSFDAITGNVPRPPAWMLRLHLEWLFRLFQQPFRAPRMLALPQFALLVLAKKIFKIDTDYHFPATRHGDDPAMRSELSTQQAEV
ncbi:WecB/TagA/CpsF family glycosyltransferase [bacterium]|nr:WecB/TagA/CpsF family glycosyltransferase [bacterium]